MVLKPVLQKFFFPFSLSVVDMTGVQRLQDMRPFGLQILWLAAE